MRFAILCDTENRYKQRGADVYLKDTESGDMVEILDLPALFDPFRHEVAGRFHAGEELQDPQIFRKTDLAFPSDEALPRCWVDPHYHER